MRSVKIAQLNVYGRLQHQIGGNRGEVKCGTQPLKGINSARRGVNGYNAGGAL